MIRWLRHPALHFAVLGALLQLVDPGAGTDAPREVLRIGDEKLAQLEEAFVETAGHAPGPEALRVLIDLEVEREILVREARRLGLHRGDPAIELRLVEKMRFVAGDSEASSAELLQRALDLELDREDLVVRRVLEQKMRLLLMHGGGQEEVDPAALRAYHAAHAERFQRAARLDLHQIGFSRDRRGEQGARRDALALGERLRTLGASPPPSAGDPSVLGAELRGVEPDQLAAVYGPHFVSALEGCVVGSWCGPFSSTYGSHLVLVRHRVEAGLQPMEEVRGQIARAVVAERRERRMRAALAELRVRYDVELPEAARRAEGAGRAGETG